MRYSLKRSYNWSSNIAYTIGLMASDGCLQKDGRHLDITSKDVDQLVNFSAAMGRDFYIGTKYNGLGDVAYRIQFGDVAYYDFLLQVGLTPSKSKTLGALLIPDEYYNDFLRGLFDGDGSCHAYMDPRWRSSYMFYIAFYSASPKFIEYLRRENSRLAHVSAGSVNISESVIRISYAKADSHLLYKFMYYDGHGPYLERKKTKLINFIQKDLLI